MGNKIENPENLPPKELDRYINRILDEVSEEARAEQMFRDMYPLGWSERHEF